MNLIGLFFRSIMSNTAKKYTSEELQERLVASGQVVITNLAMAADTPQNRAIAAHLIGIERWGQSRLNTLFGGEPKMDEYDSYRPGKELDLTSLRGAFTQTRQETLELAARIFAEHQEECIVPHNMMGNINAKTWLVYLMSHSERESSKIIRAVAAA